MCKTKQPSRSNYNDRESVRRLRFRSRGYPVAVDEFVGVRSPLAREREKEKKRKKRTSPGTNYSLRRGGPLDIAKKDQRDLRRATFLIRSEASTPKVFFESPRESVRFPSRLSYFRTKKTDIGRRGEMSIRIIHAGVPTRWTNADGPRAEIHPRREGGLPREEEEKGRERERETPTQVGPHTTVSSFVGHRMGMSCFTDTRYAALYTSWRCPAACRTASGPCNFMAEADCVRLE